MKNRKQNIGTIQKNKEGFVVVKVNETEYTISNWWGTKRKFNISGKDLPLLCKGVVNNFSAKFFGKRYKSRNFEIVKIVKLEA